MKKRSLPPSPTLWDLAVRYWGDEVDPLRPQVVCPVCRHRLDWHDVESGCCARVDGEACGCRGPDA